MYKLQCHVFKDVVFKCYHSDLFTNYTSLEVLFLTSDVALEEDDAGAAGEDQDGKRAITYQISRNKGLTPKRKKEQRNPRVKHRKKFRKAVIKRKSQVSYKMMIR